MNGEVGCAIIAQRVKIAFQPLLSSIRANWDFVVTVEICKKNCIYFLESSPQFTVTRKFPVNSNG